MARNLSETIKRARARAGLTQDALAKRAKVSRVYVIKLESGDRQSPSLAVLERLARALGVAPADLLK
jgi:transcriptional regulator with XRE-family HTH domain